MGLLALWSNYARANPGSNKWSKRKLTLQLHCKFWGASVPEYVALGIPLVSDVLSWLHCLFAGTSLLTVCLRLCCFTPGFCEVFSSGVLYTSTSPFCFDTTITTGKSTIWQKAAVPQLDIGPCSALPPHQFPLDASFQSPGGKWAFISLSNNDPQLNTYFLIESWPFGSLKSSLCGMKGSKYPKHLAITTLKVCTSGSPSARSLDMKEENFCRWQCGL